MKEYERAKFAVQVYRVKNINLRKKFWRIFLYKGQKEKVKPLRKQIECSNTTKKFHYIGERKENTSKGKRMATRSRCSEQIRKECWGFQPHFCLSTCPQPLKLLVPKTSPIQTNFLKERKSKATKSCPEVYLTKKVWILNLEGSLGQLVQSFHFIDTHKKSETTTRLCDFLRYLNLGTWKHTWCLTSQHLHWQQP